MKIILSSRRRHYVASVSIFLVVVVVVALIAGMVGCGGGGGPYTLNITSTAGGSVIVPGEGIFTYDAGTEVPLEVELLESYNFSHWGGDVDTIGNVYAVETSILMHSDYSIIASLIKFTPMVAAGWGHTVGLCSNGTVVATSAYDFSSWTYIFQVAAGGNPLVLGHTRGAKLGGTVVPAGGILGGWTDIIQVAQGLQHTVGRKSNGTVVAVKEGPALDYGECDVTGWTNIIQVAAGGVLTVGLESGGTVVAVGSNCNSGEPNSAVSGWGDITQVAAGGEKGFAVGRKSNGTVVSTYHDCSTWTDITQVAAGYEHTVGLTNTGTVVAVGNNASGQCDTGNWTDIVQVAAGAYHTVGLKSDGTVVAVGLNTSGQLNVGGWDLD